MTTDARLVDVLRRHGAQASFNLNAGLHMAERQPSWVYQGTEVWRLGWHEMKAVYAGFTIANHSLTHPYLDQLPAAMRSEITQGRERPQQFFGQPLAGFAYPFGACNEAVVASGRQIDSYFTDGLHPNAVGYRVWRDALVPFLQKARASMPPRTNPP